MVIPTWKIIQAWPIYIDVSGSDSGLEQPSVNFNWFWTVWEWCHQILANRCIYTRAAMYTTVNYSFSIISPTDTVIEVLGFLLFWFINGTLPVKEKILLLVAKVVAISWDTLSKILSKALRRPRNDLLRICGQKGRNRQKAFKTHHSYYDGSVLWKQDRLRMTTT